MATFKVWAINWQNYEDAETIEAENAQKAAEELVRKNHAKFDYTHEDEVLVKLDGQDEIYSTTVYVYSMPVFSAGTPKLMGTQP